MSATDVQSRYTDPSDGSALTFFYAIFLWSLVIGIFVLLRDALGAFVVVMLQWRTLP